MAANRREFLLGAATLAASTSLPSELWAANPNKLNTPGADVHTSSPFLLEFDEGAVTSLRFAGDAFPTNYVATGQKLGHVEIAWRHPNSAWQKLRTAESTPSHDSPATYLAQDERGHALEIAVRLAPEREILRWTIAVRNLSPETIEIGDVALPLPMHSSFNGKEPQTASVLKHSFISGHGSFLFWMRSNSVGPYLVMTPEHGTSLEYWDHLPPATKGERPAFRAYIHSTAVNETVQAVGGRWRQPRTSTTLAPAGKAGSEHTYAFQFAWALDYAGVRQRLVEAGGIDVEIAPGMTVPSDLFTCLAVRSQDSITHIAAEHIEQTMIEPLGERNGYTFYRVKFNRLGENMLTVHHGVNRTTRLEFFASEPLETLIHKRAAFIARHQVRDTSKWYNGLLGEWNMDSQVQLGPDNYDRIKGWRIYEVTCDDPGLSKPAYLASKNAEFPDQSEVEALDYYIEHFVWGGLQRTTEETDSYGIYGIPDWKQNRDSSDPGSKGRRHIWRAYDYPHIVVMYFSMYRIARDYPGINMKLAPETYLERAYGTALGMFIIPMRVVGWSAYETGFYNEIVIPQLIEELDKTGKHDQATQLRMHWEKKVAYFVSGNTNLFGSEYAFDSTGFESTQALARYALDHPATPGITPEATAKFAATQIRANLFCRGMIEKAYYYYGSDYRAGAGDSFTLSYMSPMGGWGVLNHALYDGHEPDATIRLGFASYLSSWSLMNTGTRESGCGYWFPGEANDGGTGGGFEPAAYGMTWLGQPHHRGPWYYSSETDLGYCGALRSSATIVADDPVFGRFCFGGEMKTGKASLLIVPRDGVRRRLHLRISGQKIDLELTGARFAKEEPIHWFADQQKFLFMLESETISSGKAQLLIKGLPVHSYKIRYGSETHELQCNEKNLFELSIPAGSSKVQIEITSI
ncbi:DUF5695 domain-containing protein [Silvibacterium dinghuense]|uniref:Uncharacterized protein n=1 Tax=Silvibacterium dinghuense TaxID=1560006 RepID=A0A4Q1SE51_9BACT|nr:DUF5695 domain-containing protein [Silvibacterium dinghuense]RXS95198.1 hypothetical protein ESZ00_11375 [Silvibacterium dinghuense]GGH11469.1 hypothetical protein GCM10011586_30180 [Silvibacterium dinghuense]